MHDLRCWSPPPEQGLLQLCQESLNLGIHQEVGFKKKYVYIIIYIVISIYPPTPPAAGGSASEEKLSARGKKSLQAARGKKQEVRKKEKEARCKSRGKSKK